MDLLRIIFVLVCVGLPGASILIEGRLINPSVLHSPPKVGGVPNFSLSSQANQPPQVIVVPLPPPVEPTRRSRPSNVQDSRTFRSRSATPNLGRNGPAEVESHPMTEPFVDDTGVSGPRRCVIDSHHRVYCRTTHHRYWTPLRFPESATSKRAFTILKNSQVESMPPICVTNMVNEVFCTDPRRPHETLKKRARGGISYLLVGHMLQVTFPNPNLGRLLPWTLDLRVEDAPAVFDPQTRVAPHGWTRGNGN
jgi:hypothetical protein